MLVKKRKLIPRKPKTRLKYTKKKASNSIGKKGKKDKIALIQHKRMKIQVIEDDESSSEYDSCIDIRLGGIK